jgi:hypothetical protein
MLRATRTLLATYEQPPAADADPAGLLEVVARLGTRADVEALLAAFLADPEGRPELVMPLTRMGNEDTARAIRERCLAGGRLLPGMPGQVLRCIGWHGLPGAEEILWPYARYDDNLPPDPGVEPIPDAPWDASEEATLGLLHLPCTGIRDAIRAAVAACLGRNLFPEWVVALACKTGDRELLDALYEHGATTASTSNNSGLIVGVAMFDRSEGRLWEMLADPAWEIGVSGSNTSAAYTALRRHGLGVVDVYADLVGRLASGRGDARYGFVVLSVLLELCASGRWEPPLRGMPGMEPARRIHEAVYGPNGYRPEFVHGLMEAHFPRDESYGEADFAFFRDRFHAWEELLLVRMAAEAEADALAAEWLDLAGRKGGADPGGAVR